MAKMGRPTDAVKHRFQRILEDSGSYEKFKYILRNTKKEDVFIKAFDLCHDRAFGKATQFIDMDLNDVSNRPTNEELQSAIELLRNLGKGDGLEKKE